MFFALCSLLVDLVVLLVIYAGITWVIEQFKAPKAAGLVVDAFFGIIAVVSVIRFVGDVFTGRFMF